MSTEYLAFKSDVELFMHMVRNDMQNQLTNTVAELTKINNDNTILKASLAGLQWSIKAQADAQEAILAKLEELESTSKTSVGYEGLTQALRSIEAAIITTGGRGGGSEPTSTPSSPFKTSPKKKTDTSEPMEVDIDVEGIEWKIKGGKDARDTDPFAYAFVYTSRDQTDVRDAVKEIYSLCKQYGSIQTADGFVLKLGGTNDSLLNRSIPKRK